MTDDERLYAWVRVFGAVLLLITIVVFVLAVLILPLAVEDYRVSEGTIIVIMGSLLTSALALVNVRVVLRNGAGDE